MGQTHVYSVLYSESKKKIKKPEGVQNIYIE